jgi:hypothetical protein
LFLIGATMHHIPTLLLNNKKPTTGNGNSELKKEDK